MNIPFFHEAANFEYKNSRVITKQLTKLIINQDQIYTVNSSEVSKIKSKIKAEKEERYKNISQTLEESFTKDQKRPNEIDQEKGVSNWLLCFQWWKTDLISQNNSFGTVYDYGMVGQ